MVVDVTEAVALQLAGEGTAPPNMLHERALALAHVFRRAGKQLYLVGGGVRDLLIGRGVHDIDMATDARPEQIKRLARRVRPDSMYDVGARFGTIGLTFGAHVVEITTFRTEVYAAGSRKPDVDFGTSLEEDLSRRDFTINAVAQDILSGELIDPFGGRMDLRLGLVRAVGEPAARLVEDPLRLLRAVRFAAQLGFTIEHETARAVHAHAPLLNQISGERIRDEMSKILLSPRPAAGLRLATQFGLMEHIIPELLATRGVSQRPLHHKDVFEHTMGVVENIPPELHLRWAALLHDIGKPQTKSVQDGAIHFFGHEDVGERLARRILIRLRFDHHSVGRIGKLVRLHLRPSSYAPDWTDAAVRRLIREAGNDVWDLIALSRADVTSYRQERVLAAAMRADDFERRCQELLAQEDVANLRSPLDGNELMASFGRGPGRWIQEIKDYLLEEVIEGRLRQDDRETATELARAFAAARGLLDGAAG